MSSDLPSHDMSQQPDNLPGPSASDSPTVEPSPQAMSSVERVAALATMTPVAASEALGALDRSDAARLLSLSTPEDAARMIEAMDPASAARLLEAIDPDDRVDILGHVAEEHHALVVAALDEPTRRDVRKLEQYPDDTAGGLMTTQVTALYEYLTVEDAIQMLRSLSRQLEQLYYSYVIDRGGRLIGVLSMRDMILAEPVDRLRDIMIRDVASVTARMDQEEVARIFRDRDLLAMPVVDNERRLLGVITADDVADVMAEEANEDVLRLFGAGVEEKLTTPWRLSYRKRIGWLVVNLVTAFAGAAIISRFESTIASLALLAAFMPVVSAVGGNASVQAMAVTVRGLTEGRLDRDLLRRVLTREMLVGIAGGASIGLLIFIATIALAGGSLGLSGATQLGLVVAASLAANVALGCMVGTAIPVMMSRLGFDPAQSATIFTTAATDAVGFFLLLGLANWLLL